jgi:hypothetical protein
MHASPSHHVAFTIVTGSGVFYLGIIHQGVLLPGVAFLWILSIRHCVLNPSGALLGCILRNHFPIISRSLRLKQGVNN